MTCKLIFGPFEPAIRDCFDRARADAGDTARDIKLELHEASMRAGHKAEYAALPEERVVSATWNGIATLWCSCQGFGRLARVMHEGVRRGDKRLEATPGSPVKIGLDFVTASMWFNNHDMPSDGQMHWVNGLPPPLPNPTDPTASTAIVYSWPRLRGYCAMRSLTSH